MQALIIKHDNSFDYGKLEVNDWNEKLTPNSQFHLNSKPFQLKEAKAIIFKLPNKSGFNVWFRNKLGFIEYKDLISKWNLLVNAKGDVKHGI